MHRYYHGGKLNFRLLAKEGRRVIAHIYRLFVYHFYFQYYIKCFLLFKAMLHFKEQLFFFFFFHFLALIPLYCVVCHFYKMYVSQRTLSPDLKYSPTALLYLFKSLSSANDQFSFSIYNLFIFRVR